MLEFELLISKEEIQKYYVSTNRCYDFMIHIRADGTDVTDSFLPFVGRKIAGFCKSGVGRVTYQAMRPQIFSSRVEICVKIQERISNLQV